MIRIGKGALVAASLLAMSGVGRATEAPRVVATIPPVHSLVAMVMAGVGDPELLVEGGRSPHTYALRPSDARALQEADVVFWVGEDLETFLAKPLDALPRRARVVTLHKAPGITLLSYRGDGHDHGHHDGDDHGHEDHATNESGHDDHGDHHGSIDMHVWLSPLNAAAMVEQIVATLSEADPDHASRYEANAAAGREQLAALDAELAQQLAPVRATPYIVFHEAYQYFEEHYGLSPAGSVTVAPERAPSAAKLADVRKTIRESGAVCVFSEPQFEPAVVETVIEGTGARTAVLDPLGADLSPGPEAYGSLLRRLAASFRGCLAPGG